MGRVKHCRTTKRLHCEVLEPRLVLSGNNVVISEFMALNNSTIDDGDGDASDWIELFNTGSTPADLTGYYLTDKSGDLTRWAFPTGTTIAPKSTLLVFASDKGPAGPAGEFHTSFALSGGGEFLGLVAPNGTTIVHGFVPSFPAQQSDVSFGLAMTSPQVTLVDEATPLRYVVPTNNSVDATWRSPAFNDSSWGSGTAGVGYENSPGGSSDYTSMLDVTLPAGTTTAYTRFSFNLADPSAFSTLSLGMIYDDGFAAYLNGTLVASANTPGALAWNSVAGTEPQRGDEVVLADFVDFNVSDYLGLLQAGTNVLAIHALNRSRSSDMLMIPQLTAGAAEVVEPRVDGFFDTPTPNSPNGQAFLGIVEPMQFSVERGFYSSPIALSMTTATADANIVYTTNGTAPTVDAHLNITNGILYTGPLQITHTSNIRAAAFKTSFGPTEVVTHTYIFVGDVVRQTQQAALDAGFPASWGSRSADYGLDPDVIGGNDPAGDMNGDGAVNGLDVDPFVDILLNGGSDPAADMNGDGAVNGLDVNLFVQSVIGGDAIKNSLLAIPTISLTINNADFFQSPSGIYANITQEGPLWERPVSAELIYPDGSDGFQVNAGIRIHGAASRNLSKKNALRLLFKDDYGPSKLEYPLFGEDYVSKFDTIVLRPHFNDGWGWSGAAGDPLYIRDQWFRDTQEAMGHASSRGNVVHLYINGQYWGLYNPSERPDDSYAAEHFGGDKTEYDVVNHDGLHDGTITAYNTTISMARDVKNAATVAAKNAAYQLLQGNLSSGADDPTKEDYLDVNNYIEYMMLNHYGGNDDWPNRNWYANRRRGLESAGFRFYAWDSEISLDLSTRTDVNESYVGLTTGAAQFYGILRSYAEFRLQFADAVHANLFNGGPLYVNPDSPVYDPAHPENNVPAARFDQLSATVYEAMIAESARWGDQHVSIPRTRDGDWQNQLDYMLSTYFTNRHSIVMNQWRTAGLYPTTNAPELLINSAPQHGGAVRVGALAGFSNSNAGTAGTIYYTTDGSDPRLVGGAINTASAQQFTGNIALTDVTRIRARILRGGEWSALTDATFIPGLVSSDNVVSSEINAHPVNPSAVALAAEPTIERSWWDSPRSHQPGPLRERANDSVMQELPLDYNAKIRSDFVLSSVVESRPTSRTGPHRKDARQDHQRERVLDLALVDYLGRGL
jgi:hypothetical protein